MTTIVVKSSSIILLTALSLTANSVFAQVEETVKIGNQEWMTKNLDVNKFRNGDLIPEAKTAYEWVKAGEAKEPAWCYYGNNPENGVKYGRLYNWYAVKDTRSLAPVDYHVPQDFDLTELTDFLDRDEEAFDKLESTIGRSGFLGGERDTLGLFSDVKKNGTWWSSSSKFPLDEKKSSALNFLNAIGLFSMIDENKSFGFSVRCLKENNDNLPDQATVKTGNQVWMTKNLDVDKFRNGDPIPQIQSADEWAKASSENMPAWCYYENDATNGAKYGKLYNLYAVNDPRGLAPKGWYVPCNEEWKQLISNLGASEAGTKLKSISDWSKNTNGTNSSGWFGFPGGERAGAIVEFSSIHDEGFWWTSVVTKQSESLVKSLQEGNYQWRPLIFGLSSKKDSEVFINKYYSTGDGYSVRCIKE